MLYLQRDLRTLFGVYIRLVLELNNDIFTVISFYYLLI